MCGFEYPLCVWLSFKGKKGEKRTTSAAVSSLSLSLSISSSRLRRRPVQPQWCTSMVVRIICHLSQTCALAEKRGGRRVCPRYGVGLTFLAFVLRCLFCTEYTYSRRGFDITASSYTNATEVAGKTENDGPCDSPTFLARKRFLALSLSSSSLFLIFLCLLRHSAQQHNGSCRPTNAPSMSLHLEKGRRARERDIAHILRDVSTVLHSLSLFLIRLHIPSSTHTHAYTHCHTHAHTLFAPLHTAAVG